MKSLMRNNESISNDFFASWKAVTKERQEKKRKKTKKESCLVKRLQTDVGEEKKKGLR